MWLVDNGVPGAKTENFYIWRTQFIVLVVENQKRMKNGDYLQEIRRQVDMFFDHALSLEDERVLLDRVRQDPTYHQVFSHEKSMREHLRSRVQRPGVTPDFIQSIKDHIRMG